MKVSFKLINHYQKLKYWAFDLSDLYTLFFKEEFLNPKIITKRFVGYLGLNNETKYSRKCA